MDIYLRTDEENSDNTEISRRYYKKIILPSVEPPPYSINGIRVRKELLEKIGYSAVNNNPLLPGIKNFTEHIEGKEHESECFSLWYTDNIKKSEKAFIGTFNWLMDNEYKAKEKEYPKKWKKALGLVPRKNSTPVDFDLFLGLMRSQVGNALKKSTFLIEKPYDPRRQDPRSFQYQARKRKIKEIGPIVHYMGAEHSHWIQCWYFGLKSAREIDPLSKKLSLNHKFLGGLFPVGYRDNANGHPRLLFKNYNNISNMKGSWRISAASIWEQNTGLHLYTIDISSAHARFFYWAISSFEKIKKTSGVLLDDNFWDTLTAQFLKVMQIQYKLPYKPIRRMFKIGSLALMNGGALKSKKNLLPAIKGKLDLNGEPIKWSITLLATYFANLKSSVEIKIASKTLENSGIVWPMGSIQRYVKTDKPHQALSAIYCGPELLALTHLVQISLLEGIDLLPLSLEMDGLVVASQVILSEEELNNLENVFNVVLKAILGIHLPVKIKSLV